MRCANEEWSHLPISSHLIRVSCFHLEVSCQFYCVRSLFGNGLDLICWSHYLLTLKNFQGDGSPIQWCTQLRWPNISYIYSWIKFIRVIFQWHFQLSLCDLAYLDMKWSTWKFIAYIKALHYNDVYLIGLLKWRSKRCYLDGMKWAN